MAKVALYGRNSGEDQEKAETIETQRRLLMEWARREGHEVISWYPDEAVRSIVPIAERKEGGRLLRDAARGRFELVVCYKLSRWSRYADVWHAGRDELRRHGVDLVCLHDDTSDRTPGERFSLGVRLLVNEYERDNIEHTCLDGRYTWAQAGCYTGGFVPFGYRPTPDPERRDGGRRHLLLAVDPAEAQVIRLIFQWCVEERLSTAQIAARLTGQGMPRPTATHSPERYRNHRTSGALHWTAATVRDILKNPRYKGSTTFGGSPGSRRDPVPVTSPVIVDSGLWEAAQVQLARNRKESRRPGDRHYLLRGLVHCPDCNRVLQGETLERTTKRGHRVYTYYFCPGRNKPPLGRGHCPLPYIPAAALEEDLWATLIPLIQNREETVARLRAELVRGERKSHAVRATCDGLRGAVEKKRLQLDRAVALALEEPPKITFEELDRQRARLGGEIESLLAELTRLHAEETALLAQEERLGSVADWLVQWREDVEKPSLAGQRRVLEQFVNRVDVTMEAPGPDGTPEVRFRYELCLDPAPVATKTVPVLGEVRSSCTQHRNSFLLVVPGALRRAA